MNDLLGLVHVIQTFFDIDAALVVYHAVHH